MLKLLALRGPATLSLDTSVVPATGSDTPYHSRRGYLVHSEDSEKDPAKHVHEGSLFLLPIRKLKRS